MKIIKKGIVYFLIAGSAVVGGSSFVMDFLGKWEGEAQYTVYADKLAGGLPTVCKGITRFTSPYPVIVGERWSPEKCEEVENSVVLETQKNLAQCIKVEVPQEVFDALTSHAHNFGWPSTCNSQTVKEINKGNYEKGCNLLSHKPNGSPNWSYIDGVFYRGLYNRRLDEEKLCLSGLK